MLSDSTFCFVNSHLAAHQNQTSARNSDIANIIKETSFPAVAQQAFWNQGGDGSMLMVVLLIQDHENIFWSGDLNYRIDMTRNAVIEAIEAKNWQLLSVL
jgi:hypothetical protein